MTETWSIEFYQDKNGISPVKVFQEASLTSGEQKQLQVRLKLLKSKGLLLLRERSDILKQIKGEKKLYELRLDNTPNNPRIFLCALTGKRLIFLHGFKKKGQKTPKLEIEIAVRRRDQLMEEEKS
ncbi:protein of unknown function DUF891 [Rippkaea orientalis PCC 8801]|uniref:Type II toxin-antitoxin system RelE/ParE family toxin n=1 Tax=Rippkaea orientalis (strain PCC 8801 / RF-1) TaxID=41431 RepID=B7JUW7_RIPO1|nr:type II toxin-antitoxin system RelE/ParE family toxin [Rippkaea orientalis]ACK66819.1 protein of unknown function DUF891 [Rippkaea orientalis PCC 8801]